MVVSFFLGFLVLRVLPAACRAFLPTQVGGVPAMRWCTGPCGMAPRPAAPMSRQGTLGTAAIRHLW
ncbi:MAG: hypothetical protein EBX36_03440 [Planctomycetia bacterium]|nr:hypothetical protein [Planctomycetia bacterium]